MWRKNGLGKNTGKHNPNINKQDQINENIVQHWKPREHKMSKTHEAMTQTPKISD